MDENIMESNENVGAPVISGVTDTLTGEYPVAQDEIAADPESSIEETETVTVSEQLEVTNQLMGMQIVFDVFFLAFFFLVFFIVLIKNTVTRHF